VGRIKPQRSLISNIQRSSCNSFLLGQNISFILVLANVSNGPFDLPGLSLLQL